MGGGVLGVIPARGGSRGIPRKNLALAGGRPLIEWTIDAAASATTITRVIVSTEDDEIAAAARAAGAEVPFVRPGELATDEASSVDVVLHALDALAARDDDPMLLVLLQPTSPLRSAEDIDAAVSMAIAGDAPAVVTVAEANPHPWLTRRVSTDGTLSAFLDHRPFDRRQELEPAYALNGAVYVIRPAVLRGERTFEPAGTRASLMPAARSLDIDTPWDLLVADLVLAAPRGAS